MLAQGLVQTVKNWWILLVIGILYIAAGIFFLINPGITFQTLALLFAIILIIDGLSSIYFALQSRDVMEGWGWGLAAGILYALIGFALLWNQEAARTTLILLLGFLIVMRGSLSIALSFETRKMGLPYWGWALFFGLVVIGLGIFVVVNPNFGVALIVALVAISFVMMGIGLAAASLSLRNLKRAAESGAGKLRDRLSALRERVAAFDQMSDEEAKAFMQELKEELRQASEEADR